MRFIHDLITLYVWILIVTALLSWFPVQNSSGGLATTKHILASITEPVLRPLRAILPRPSMGGVGVDLSVLVAVIVLIVINSVI
jgi:YggT family protein